MSYKLLISIVPHDMGELITNAAKEAGAGGGSDAGYGRQCLRCHHPSEGIRLQEH